MVVGKLSGARPCLVATQRISTLYSHLPLTIFCTCTWMFGKRELFCMIMDFVGVTSCQNWALSDPSLKISGKTSSVSEIFPVPQGYLQETAGARVTLASCGWPLTTCQSVGPRSHWQNILSVALCPFQSRTQIPLMLSFVNFSVQRSQKIFPTLILFFLVLRFIFLNESSFLFLFEAQRFVKMHQGCTDPLNSHLHPKRAHRLCCSERKKCAKPSSKITQQSASPMGEIRC